MFGGLPSNSTFTLPWGGDAAYLLQKAKGVEGGPMFLDLAATESADENPCERHLFSTSRDTHKLAFVSATKGPPNHYLVALRN